MENVSLKDFIAEALASIAIGVKEAQDYSRANGGVPIALSAVGGDSTSHGEQLVSFSVSLAVEKSTSINGKGQLGGALVSAIAGKAEVSGAKNSKQNDTHNVTFSVPIHFNAIWPQSQNETVKEDSKC
jgi:hypothetical protein